MSDLEYSGNVTIKVQAIQETHYIILDSAVSVNNVQTSVKMKEWTKSSKHVIIHLEEELIPNKKEEIFLSFNGNIRVNSTAGFYASFEKSVLALTQFETDGANSVFPCFDDPALKANFRITIAVDNTFNVIGNMELEKFTQLEKSLFIFKKTPKLSTYLVAW